MLRRGGAAWLGGVAGGDGALGRARREQPNQLTWRWGRHGSAAAGSSSGSGNGSGNGNGGGAGGGAAGVGGSDGSDGGNGDGDDGVTLLTHRELAVQWILRSALEFCKCDRTVHLAVGILDHVIRLHPPPLDVAAISDGSGSWIELLGIAALLLACKFQEVEIHTVEEFVYYADARYDAGDALEAEVRICSALRLDFAIPTALDFLYCLLHRLQWPTAFAVHRGLDCEAVMLAQLLCELSLLSHELSVCPRSSLVASCALCLSLACLRCGCWRDGSPGPASMPELYWTPSMVQATGYTRDDLRAPMGHLQAIHEQAAVHIHNINVFAPDGQWDKWAVLKYKFAQPRFLNILRVPPFTPHQGGSVFFASSANAAGRSHVAGSPLAQPAYHLAPPAAAADALPFDGGGGDAEPAAAPEQVQ